MSNDKIMRELGISNLDVIENENDIQETSAEDFFASSKKDLENFDKNAWSKGKGIILPNYPYITEKLEGMDSGLYLFAGKSNHGKSAAMMNIMSDACNNPDNTLYGLYYSLDDSKDEIIPRFIAMDQRIPISVAAKPKRFQDMIDDMEENSSQYVEMLVKRRIGLDNLLNNVDKLKIEDSTKIQTTEDMYNHIKSVITYLRAINPNYKVIIAIDSINDLRIDYVPKDGDVLAEVSRIVKHWTVEFDCIIFASTHIRKLNGNRRPTLEDLKDSSVLVYEASLVWIVFNDVSENKQGAKIYQVNPDSQEKLPILELDWAKNKKSSYKGRSYCYFRPEYSKTIECDEEANKRFTGLIYEA